MISYHMGHILAKGLTSHTATKNIEWTPMSMPLRVCVCVSLCLCASLYFFECSRWATSSRREQRTQGEAQGREMIDDMRAGNTHIWA